MKFSYDIYLKYIKNRKFEKAHTYKNKYIPNTLYKFFSLSENEDDDLSLKKLDYLDLEYMWMPYAQYLNDPFELRAIYLSKDEIEKFKFEDVEVENINNHILDKLKEGYIISSLTENVLDIMPMWAHYANNHRGYCLEFETVSKHVIYPIKYVEHRNPIGSWLDAIDYLSTRLENGEIEEDNIQLQVIREFMYIFGMYKHFSWKYEKEYRVMLPYTNNKEVSGMVTPFDGIGLKLKSIIIGYACNTQYEDILREIANNLKVECKKASMDIYNKEFKLKCN